MEKEKSFETLFNKIKYSIPTIAKNGRALLRIIRAPEKYVAES